MMRAAFLASLVGSLLGCDAGTTGLHHHRDPGTLVVAQAADVQALDPVRVTDNESIEIGELIFEGLVGWKPGTTDIVPALATRWEVSADSMRWTFHLREDVRFHDDTSLDAAAVVFSFERVLDPKHPAFLADGAYWRTLLQDVSSVRAVDAHTVEIATRRPYAPLLGELALFPIVSPTATMKWGDEFRAHPVGTGPFQLEAWHAGEQVIVARFASYWGPKPDLDRIVFDVQPDARQRLIDLESGSVDLAMAILPDEQSFVELHPDLVLHHAPSNDVSYLAFNTQHPPFDDPRVRRAASYAINKEPIVKLAYQGRAVPADGPLPPSQWGYHAPAIGYAYDPEKAKQLVADAKLDPNKVYKLYAPSTPRPYLSQPERVARYLQAALEQVGIHTEVVLHSYKEHVDTTGAGEHDLALFGWIGDTGDPDNFLYVLFSSDNAVSPDAQNIAFFKDPLVDKLLADAQAAVDQPARARFYAEVQDQIAIAAPWVPIAHSELVVAGRRELGGVILSPLGHPVYRIIRRAQQ